MATPQPIAIPGIYTLALGVDNVYSNLPPVAYLFNIAWVSDRPGTAGYMVSDGVNWTADVGPQGPQGNAGSAGINGNTILSGTGVPAVGLGANGDFYVDVVATRMYGPKLSGTWGSGVPLVGPAGTPGTPGATGPTGPAGLGTVTPSTPTRVIGTAFQPSSTKAVACSYSIRTQVTNPLLAGSSTATVQLLSDASNPPTTVRATVAAESSVALAVAIAITTANTAVLNYIVPPGHYARIVSVTTGTAATSIVSQTEEALG